MQRGRTCFHCCLSLIALLAFQAGSLEAATLGLVVDDSWTDDDRTMTGVPEPLDADWWSSSQTSGSNVQVDPNSMTLVTGSSGRGLHATFAPQNLNVGQTIVATYTFTTPATVGANKGAAFKVALMDGSDPNLADDQSSSSSSVNPVYTNLPGYMTDFDINTGTGADVSMREHKTPNTTGRFLGTTSEWDQIGSSSDAGYSILANTEYVGVMSIKRTGADSVDIFGSLSQGGVLLDSNIETDASGIANNFGMLGFWANGGVFGSSNSAGDPDNGMVFSNVTVEVIPEPSSLGLCLGVVTLLSAARKRR